MLPFTPLQAQGTTRSVFTVVLKRGSTGLSAPEGALPNVADVSNEKKGIVFSSQLDLDKNV